MVWFTSVNVVGMAVGTSAAVALADVGAGAVVLLEVVPGAVTASTAATVPLGDGVSAPLPRERSRPGG